MTWLALTTVRTTRLHALSAEHLIPTGLCGVALKRAVLAEVDAPRCRMCERVAARKGLI